MSEVVQCHSGYAYAQRPVAFFWEGTQYAIEAVQNEWRSPAGKHFRVLTKHGSCFELVYDQSSDDWQIYEN